jgi:hypothetical protein
MEPISIGAWMLALILLPVLIILWATESKTTLIRTKQ